MRQNKRKNNSRGRNGFSLFEVVLVIGVSALVIFVIGSFSSNLNVIKNLVSQKLQSRSDVDQALQVMTTEIRSAGPSSLGSYPVEAASTSSFTFFSDINKNNFFYRVRYFLGTSTVQKGIVMPTGNPLTYVTSTEIVSTVVTDVTFPSSTQPLFNYYDSSYTGSQAPLSSPIDITKIRTVQISLSVDTATSTAPRAEFFTATVGIRNLKTN